ncbi:MAG TPA: hypothetical protein PL183_08900 [Aquamicrobium sp.]|nr:hypothetical protein [Aquamicrobium sp.]
MSMFSRSMFSGSLFSGVAAMAVAVILGTGPVHATEWTGDRVHADSFGNLVIHSPAGYKRIIVGMGHAARGYQLTGSYYEPESAAFERAPRRCWRPPHRWQGRSHMYGLEQGVVPQAPLVCR